MYAGPLQTDCYAVDGMKEIGIVDSNYRIILLRIFGKALHLYKEHLQLAEQNTDILVASNMDANNTSSKFITFIYYASSSFCGYINSL